MDNGSYRAPTKCPVCSGDMIITEMHCPKCSTNVSGDFSPCKFCMLEEKHLQFVETFLRCRGSIKEVEKALGVSYPTVRNMMDAALEALGLSERPETMTAEKEAKEDILEKLHSKEISVEAALKELQEIKGE